MTDREQYTPGPARGVQVRTRSKADSKIRTTFVGGKQPAAMVTAESDEMTPPAVLKRVSPHGMRTI